MENLSWLVDGLLLLAEHPNELQRLAGVSRSVYGALFDSGLAAMKGMFNTRFWEQDFVPKGKAAAGGKHPPVDRAETETAAAREAESVPLRSPNRRPTVTPSVSATSAR